MKKFITVQLNDKFEETFIFSEKLDHPEYFDMLIGSSYQRYNPKLISAGIVIPAVTKHSIFLCGDSGLLNLLARKNETEMFFNQFK